MKGVSKVSGYVLLVIGLIGIAFVVGDVLSRGTGVNLIDLAPGLAFHTVCMVGGTALVARGAVKTATAQVVPVETA